MNASPWDAVAAPGTDPERLARAVAARLGTGGAPRRVAHRLVTGTGDELAVTPDGSVTVPPALHPGEAGERALVDRVLDPYEPGPAVTPVVEAWGGLGVVAAVLGDPAYPARLARRWPALAAPLLFAWRAGAAVDTGTGRRHPGPGGDGPVVAIVGARRATGYGTGVAAWLAGSAGDAGVTVVSGGAVGVDAAAHEAALATRGNTAVVLGCGHDVAYPRAHTATGGLFDRVLDGGGWLVSEFLPGTRPHPPNVLARNRIVAGLADVVVVVEGGERSGALRTASVAADLGIPVLAVPGDVRAAGSAAPHRLLAEGAAPCTGPQDLLAALDAARPEQPALPLEDGDPGGAPASCLPPEVHEVLATRWPRPVRVDELATLAGLPVGRLLAALTEARVAGELAEGADGVRLTRAPAT